MKIIRTFNNNVVSAWTDDKIEIIAIGSGIGFQKKARDTLDESKIEKKYILDNKERSEFNQLYDKTKFKYFDVSEHIYQEAVKQFEYPLGNQVMISLIDHISYAIQRVQSNLMIPNLLLTELKVLYKKEYRFGEWAIEYIEEQTKVMFPKDEAGYIAMHLINSSTDYKATAAEIIKISSEIRNIIFNIYNLNLSESNFSYSRLLMHLKFLAQRIISNESITDFSEADKRLYTFLQGEDSKIPEYLHEINIFIKANYNRVLTLPEELYLMIHVLQIINN